MLQTVRSFGVSISIDDQNNGTLGNSRWLLTPPAPDPRQRLDMSGSDELPQPRLRRSNPSYQAHYPESASGTPGPVGPAGLTGPAGPTGATGAHCDLALRVRRSAGCEGAAGTGINVKGSVPNQAALPPRGRPRVMPMRLMRLVTCSSGTPLRAGSMPVRSRVLKVRRAARHRKVRKATRYQGRCWSDWLRHGSRLAVTSWTRDDPAE